MNNGVIAHIDETDVSLWTLFWTYLKIGSTAFGGFMALISVVQNYLVEKKKLLTDDDMLDGITLATILPGPIAVNVVTYTGYKIRGIKGAAVCFTAVILPSFLLILGLSYAYFTFGNIPAVSSIFMGFIPAVAAIIIVASINLGKKSITGISQFLIATIAMFLLILIGGLYITISIIILSGLVGYLLYRNNDDKTNLTNTTPQDKSIPYKKPSPILVAFMLTTPAIIASVLKFQTLLSIKLLAVFSGMSLMLFGGGFVFIPMIQEVVVDSYGWLSHREFIDGIALGQITPGPIVISATFIGYKVAGFLGAVTATIGAFLPPALLMLLCTSYLEKIKSSNLIQPILKGIRCGVIGMIVAAGYVVALTAEQNLISLIIFVTAMIMLLKFRTEVILLIPLSGLAGYLSY